MAILAIDLGTTTGWCARQRNGHVTSGTISFQPRRFEGGGMRYLRFSQWLFEINEILGGIESVYFEEVRRHLGVDAAHAYGAFMGQLTSFCEQHKIPYQGIPVGTIKKFATGRGNATKDNMIDFARSKGFEPQDDNEADAIAILYCVTSNMPATIIDCKIGQKNEGNDRSPNNESPFFCNFVVNARTGQKIHAVNDLILTPRSVNALKKGNIYLVADLVQKSESDLLEIPGLGKESIIEIKEMLAYQGLSLRQTIKTAKNREKK